MENPFRLQSDALFVRPEEVDQEPPRRIAFLSVEGNDTEADYFEWVQKYRNRLGIKTEVYVHSLKRAKSDTLSAPQDVLELLEEYIELREAAVLPERIRKAIPAEYTDDFIRLYMEDANKLEQFRKEEFEMLLRQAEIDLVYARFLKEISGENDLFGVVIDRDYRTHSVTQMKKIVTECEQKGYYCFIATPCFEFWLLMHLADINREYQGQMQNFRENKRLSKQHTFTSKEVSKRAGHGKKISENVFTGYYLPQLDFAIRQVKEAFSFDKDKLIGTDETEDTKRGELGTNLSELFDLLREM